MVDTHSLLSRLEPLLRFFRLDFSPVEFRSPLSLDQCEARLADMTVWNQNGDTPVIGEVSRDHFFLYAKPKSRNPFQTCLTGRMVPAGSGTLLDCRFTILTFAQAFLVVWFGIGGWIGIRSMIVAAGELLAGRADMPDGSSALESLLLPPLLFLGGYLLVRLGRRHAEEDRRMLVRFMGNTLSARQIIDGGVTP